VAVLLATVASICTTASGQSVAAWQRDLDTLLPMLEARHPSAYHTTPRSQMESRIRQLRDEVPLLSREQILVRLAAILALVGDGHTGLFLPWDTDLRSPRLPLEVIDAEDGVAVLAAAPQYATLVGGRVVRIGSVPMDSLRSKLLVMLSGDNAHTPRSLIGYYLPLAGVLRGVGAMGPDNVIEVAVEHADGSTQSVPMRVGEGFRDSTWITAPGNGLTPDWLARQDEMYWYRFDSTTATLFVQYNRADAEREDLPLLEFGEALVGAVERTAPQHVVVDLRWNSGGSWWWSNVLLHALIRVEAALGESRGRHRVPSNRLLVLIGPATFSAATNFALDLEEHTNATFVGEPTGGRPTVYGGSGRFTLPTTGLTIRHAREAQINAHPGDAREALEPSIPAPIRVADLRTGRDPAISAILGQH
jgi:hypothetical protein